MGLIGGWINENVGMQKQMVGGIANLMEIVEIFL
jgi:hypothetical protein